MSNDLREFILYRVLRHKFYVESQELSKMIEFDESLPLKNVCAKLSLEISDRLDNIVEILAVSKRSFIERALVYAIDTAEEEFQKVLSEKWTDKEREQMINEHLNAGEK